MTDTQNLISQVEALARKPGFITANTRGKDVHGRELTCDGKYFTEDGKFSNEMNQFLKSLEDKENQKLALAGIMYYDIRSKFWRDNPQMTVALALVYAKKLQKINGKKDGIVIHVGVDAYQKHFDAAQVFVDAILRTGICDNGGGVYYWGCMNGGDMRNYSQLYHAMNDGVGGNWFYFTMSHKPNDFLGCKIGAGAKVYCGSNLRPVEGVTSGTLYNALVEKDFAEIKNTKPEGEIIVVNCQGDEHNNNNNNLEVAADLLKATSAPSDIETSKLLEGLELGVDMGGSPIAQNMVRLLRGLGADVIVDNEELDPSYNISHIIDPNEHRSDAVERIRQRAKQTNRTWLMIDPDGDRGSLAEVGLDGEPVSMTGSELLQVSMESIAKNFKQKGHGKPTVIADMRTGLGADDLGKLLNEHDLPIEVIPVEAGYPFFMRAMADLPADMAVENTCHEFLTPMTSEKWGAPKDFPGHQGGDNAALYMIYLLGNRKYLWEGRNTPEQLAHLQKEYGLKKTVVDELKPAMPVEDDAFKYDIAEAMKEIAPQILPKEHFKINFGNPKVSLLSGVHITSVSTHAMALIRFSNTGSTFTISGAGYTREELDELLGLGARIMKLAVDKVKEKGNEFTFDFKDAEGFEDKFDPQKYGMDM